MRSTADLRRRQWIHLLMTGLCFACVCLALIPLGAVLWYVGREGLAHLNWAFFTELPKPVGIPHPGMANAIVGSLIMVGLATLIAVPIGVGGGIYLSEYGRDRRVAEILCFVTDLLSGVPSIVVGIFVYTWLVLWMRAFSALAGGVALAIIMLPVITRTAEEMLRLVPGHLREAALALGLPRWRVILRVVIPSARSGIVSGVMLAVARAAGETAPLLFTALNNQFWSFSLTEPMASLPVQIYVYAISPYDEWRGQAWAAALTLLAIVLVLSLGARFLTRAQDRVLR